MSEGNYIIDFLLKKDENVFFETEHNALKVLTIACALGNTNGGTIVLGVNKKGETIGMEEAYFNDVKSQLDKMIFPSLPFTITPLERDGLLVAVIAIWEGADKPYMLDGQIYLQKDSKVEIANSEQLRQIIDLKLKAGKSWERTPVFDSSLEDISENVVTKFRQSFIEDKKISQEETSANIMKRLGFIQMGSITNAGIVIAAKDPVSFFPQARIRVSVFGENDSLQDVKLYESNLIESIEPILNFIYSLYPQKIEIAGAIRYNYETLPKIALREGLLNALVHRTYDDYQSFMRVNVYIDRLEIINSGQLPDGLTIDDLSRRHISHLRNPDIANAFYVLRYIEAAGSGTLRIIDECKKNHCALPEWRQDDNTVTLTFKAELPREKFSKSTITDNIIKGLTHNVDAQKHLYAIYMSIRNNGNIKVANVQELTGKSYISCKRYLQLLKEAGLIEYRGSLKTGGWYTVSQ